MSDLDPLESPDDVLQRQIEAEFADLADERYPGSRRQRRAISAAPATVIATDDPGWDNYPRRIVVRGKEREFFTIGQLAMAINRKPVTIRKWEQKGVIPKARYRTPDKKRLYSRRQVEGMVEICHRHGLLQFRGRPNAGTVTKAFTKEVIALFKEDLD